MRAHRRLIAIVASLAIVGAACGGDDDATSDTAAPVVTTAPAVTTPDTTEPDVTTPETTEPEVTTPETSAPTETTEPPYVPPARGDADLVIWADDTRAPVLTPLAEAFSADEGVKVSVLEVPFDKIRDNLSTAGPAGEGPDIIIGAHDWLGELVANGALEPIELGAAADAYSAASIQAFNYDNKQYGLPYAVENIALIRNTDLVPDAPATFEDLEATALALQADGTVSVPLAIQQGPADPYRNYPLFSGAGGYIFGQSADGTYDPDDLGIDSDGGLKAAELFKKWSDEGLISKDVVMSTPKRFALYDAGGRPPAIPPSTRSERPDHRRSACRVRRQPAVIAMSKVWDTWKDVRDLHAVTRRFTDRRLRHRRW